MPGVLLNLMAACISLCHSGRLPAVHSTICAWSISTTTRPGSVASTGTWTGEKGSRSLRVDCLGWADLETINRRGGSEIRGYGSRYLVVLVDQRYRRPPVERAAGMADSE